MGYIVVIFATLLAKITIKCLLGLWRSYNVASSINLKK